MLIDATWEWSSIARLGPNGMLGLCYFDRCIGISSGIILISRIMIYMVFFLGYWKFLPITPLAGLIWCEAGYN